LPPPATTARAAAACAPPTVWLTRETRGKPFTPNVPPRALWAAGALIVLFTVLRNTPAGTWLAP
jgi:hypothetical protein